MSYRNKPYSEWTDEDKAEWNRAEMERNRKQAEERRLEDEWRENLVVGDEVLVVKRYRTHHEMHVKTVIRATKTKLVISGGYEVRRQTGRTWGGGNDWGPPMIVRPTEERIREDRERQLRTVALRNARGAVERVARHIRPDHGGGVSGERLQELTYFMDGWMEQVEAEGARDETN